MKKQITVKERNDWEGETFNYVIYGSTDWKKPLIDRCKYELRRYSELAKRMDELMHECNLAADYVGAKEAEIKRNCYNRFVNDLKQLVS